MLWLISKKGWKERSESFLVGWRWWISVRFKNIEASGRYFWMLESDEEGTINIINLPVPLSVLYLWVKTLYFTELLLLDTAIPQVLEGILTMQELQLNETGCSYLKTCRSLNLAPFDFSVWIDVNQTQTTPVNNGEDLLKTIKDLTKSISGSFLLSMKYGTVISVIFYFAIQIKILFTYAIPTPISIQSRTIDRNYS